VLFYQIFYICPQCPIE